VRGEHAALLLLLLLLLQVLLVLVWVVVMAWFEGEVGIVCSHLNRYPPNLPPAV
jgi:hypothetical protein